MKACKLIIPDNLQKVLSSEMSFYFRKLRQSLRLVPATKSLGHSTLVHDGDKLKDGDTSPKIKKYSKCAGHGEMTDLSVIISSPSALVPLSVRDMAMVLPRLDRNSARPLDDLDPFIHVAKTVSISCDDILAEHFNSYPPSDQGTMLERLVVNVKHCEYERYKSVVDRDIFHHGYPNTPVHWEVCENYMLNNTGYHGSEKMFKTLFISDNQFPHFDGCLLSSSSEEKKDKWSGKEDGPSPEQLHSIKDRLDKSVNEMFTRRYDYSLLHKNVIFENNLFGDNRISRGQTSYALELLNLRFKIHTRFSSTKMEVLNIMVHEDSGVIRIHWRLKGLPQTEVLKFWRLFQSRDEISKDDWQWFEAFSYFHIGKDGLVHKHRIDRMLPGGEEPDKLSHKLRKLLNPTRPLVN